MEIDEAFDESSSSLGETKSDKHLNVIKE